MTRRAGRRRKHRWSEPDFRAACAVADGIAAVLAHFNVPLGHAGYRAVHLDVAVYAIDTSHWTGCAHARGGRSQGRPLAELLRSGQRLNRTAMKARLVREGVLCYACYGCGNGGTWRDRPLSLHLDHINGDPDDWRRENLRFACPNCHAQTETYCGRNRARDTLPGRRRYRPHDFAALAARHQSAASDRA